MKILLSINQDLLDNLDSFCAKFGYQRSEFIRNCIRSEIFSQLNESVGVGREETLPVVSGLFKVTKPIELPPMPKKVIKDVKKLQKVLSSVAGSCEHGAALGNCKFGCRPGKVADSKAQLKNIVSKTKVDLQLEPLPDVPPKVVIAEPNVVPFTFSKTWNTWVCPHQNEEGQCPMGCRRAK